MPAPASLVLLDTRLWDGTLFPTNPGDPGGIESQGSLTGVDFDNFLFDNGAGDIASHNTTGACPTESWATLGGTPQGGNIFTLIVAVGVAQSGVSSRSFIGIGPIAWDVIHTTAETESLFYDPITQSTNSELGFEYSSGFATPGVDELWSMEVDVTTGQTATADLRINNTIVDSNTQPDYGTSINAAWPNGNWCSILSATPTSTTPGDPWPIVGAVFKRGAIDDTERDEWYAYFFDAAPPPELVVGTPDRYIAVITKPTLGGLQW